MSCSADLGVALLLVDRRAEGRVFDDYVVGLELDLLIGSESEIARDDVLSDWRGGAAGCEI